MLKNPLKYFAGKFVGKNGTAGAGDVTLSSSSKESLLSSPSIDTDVGDVPIYNDPAPKEKFPRSLVMSSDGIWFLPELPPSVTDEKDDISLIAPKLPFRAVAMAPKTIDYSRPLPPPPAGFKWERNGRHWQCVEIDRNEDQSANEITYTEGTWLEHVVMPEDTIQGICLKYKTSVLELRRNNNFSGSAFRSRKVLRIRVNAQVPISPQEETDEVKIQRLRNMTDLGSEECRYYLTESGWNLVAALNAWQMDVDWEERLCDNAVTCQYQSSRLVSPTNVEIICTQTSFRDSHDAKPLLGNDPIRYVLL
jgi:hypothetical protein